MGKGRWFFQQAFEGELEIQGRLTIDPSAAVKGMFRSEEIHIRGAVEGSLEGTRMVTLETSARVDGDVTTPRLQMMAGAYLNGNITMEGPPGVPQKAKDVSVTTAPEKQSPTLPDRGMTAPGHEVSKTPAAPFSVISRDICIEGELEGSENLTIEGRVQRTHPKSGRHYHFGHGQRGGGRHGAQYHDPGARERQH